MLRCATCPSEALAQRMASPVGFSLQRAADLLFQGNHGFALSLDDISDEEYRGMKALDRAHNRAQEERQRQEAARAAMGKR